MGEKLVREGQEHAGPTVAFDPKQRANYHLDGLGRRVPHGCPPEYVFDDRGELHPAGEAAVVDPEVAPQVDQWEAEGGTAGETA